MKTEKLLEELNAFAKSLGYSVRREPGSFRGGACIVHDKKHIIINRSMPLEAACVVLARAICTLSTEDVFLKPAVRDIIERERYWAEKNPDVTFEVPANEGTEVIE